MEGGVKQNLGVEVVKNIKKIAGPRNRTWVCSATTNCTNHYTRPAMLKMIAKGLY